MVRYLLEFICCSALFYVLYRSLIEGRVAHHLARIYIIVTTLLSIVIPLLELPLYPAESLSYLHPTVSGVEVIAEKMDVEQVAGVDWILLCKWLVVILYVVVVLLNLVHFGLRLREVLNIKKHSKLTSYDAYTLAESGYIQEPFSFWRTIYIGDKFSATDRELVILHESSHIRRHHTEERLLMEAIRCIFWFNPFVWLAANSLIEVQEWEADMDVIDKGYDIEVYRLLVFQQLYGYYPEVTCGLKCQTSKKRFLMMTNFKKGRFSSLRLGIAVPVMAAMILAFGAVRAEGVTVTDVLESTDAIQSETPTSSQPSEIKTADLLQQFSNYYKSHIRYPSEAKSSGIDGRVVVYCFVNLVDGSATLQRVIKSPSEILTAEVERVIKARKWEDIESVASCEKPKVILSFDFVIDGKSDPSKWGKAVNGIVVKTYDDNSAPTRSEKSTITINKVQNGGEITIKEELNGKVVSIIGTGDKQPTSKPLIIVKDTDGKERCIKSVKDIEVQQVKSMTMFKDEANKERYAHLGDTSDGVVLVELR